MTVMTHQAPRQTRTRSQKMTAGQFIMVSIGELLIILGLLVGGYVVWQLWWTSVQVSGGVNESISTFQAEHPVQDTTTIAPERTDPPPAVAQPGYGETFGVLHVPKWNWMQIPITQGIGTDVLDLGHAGHYPDTQLPGEIGNFAVAGHRRTYGNNFRRVDILEPGDPLVVETADAYLVYEMTGNEIVDPSQWQVIAPVPNNPSEIPTQRLMTMTTCHPEFGNSERFIVYSELKYWTSKADGIPQVLADEPTR